MSNDKQKTAAPAKEKKAEVKQPAKEAKEAPAAKTAEKTAEPVEKAAKKTNKKEKTTLSKKAAKIVDAVKELSLMEVSELVSALEDEFGVSAAAPVMMGAMPAGAAGEAAAVEEQTEFDVILKDAGSNKIGAIKAVRKLKPNLGLGDAKTFVESAPKPVLEAAKKEDAEAAKKELEAAGCVIELK